MPVSPTVLTISARFGFQLDQPTDVLLQFEAAATAEQRVLHARTSLPPAAQHARVAAFDKIGERIWLRGDGRCDVAYDAAIEVARPAADLAALAALPAHELPGEVAEFLFDSRYCQAWPMGDLFAAEFAGLSGGALVLAMRDWAARHIAYRPGTSTASTTAADTFAGREGICRDFSHVIICLARAAMIPARYVSCYAPGVTPQDFHAVAEVFLADTGPDTGPKSGPHPSTGAWHMVDATGMSTPGQTARIGVGRDAGDVSFLTVFGNARFDYSEVAVFASQTTLPQAKTA